MYLQGYQNAHPVMMNHVQQETPYSNKNDNTLCFKELKESLLSVQSASVRPLGVSPDYSEQQTSLGLQALGLLRYKYRAQSVQQASHHTHLIAPQGHESGSFPARLMGAVSRAAVLRANFRCNQEGKALKWGVPAEEGPNARGTLLYGRTPYIGCVLNKAVSPPYSGFQLCTPVSTV